MNKSFFLLRKLLNQEGKYYEEETFSSPSLLNIQRDEILSLLEKARVEALEAGNVGLIGRQDQICELVWNIANDTSDLEYKACAEWCSGLTLLFREQARAAQYFERARNFFDQAGRSYESARISINLILLYCQLGRYVDAENTAQTVISVLSNYPNYRNWPSVYLNASLSARYLGHFEDMLERAQQAENIAALYEQQETVLRARVNQSLALCFMGRLDEALKLADNVLSQVAHIELESEVKAQARLARATVWQNRGQLFESLKDIYQASLLFEKIGQHVDVATCAIDEAALYARLGMPRDAIRCYSMAATQFEKAGLPAENAETLCGMARLALFSDPSPIRARAALDKLFAQPIKPDFITLTAEVYARHPMLLSPKSSRASACEEVRVRARNLENMGVLAQYFDAEYVSLLLEDKKQVKMRGAKALKSAHEHGFYGVERMFHQYIAASLKPKEAREHLLKAVNLLERERTEIGSEELKASALTGHAPLYAELITTELALGMPREAAQTLLRAKGGLWSDLVPSVSLQKQKEESNIDLQWKALRNGEGLWKDRLKNAKTEQGQAEARHQLEAVRVDMATFARQRPIPNRGVKTPALENVREQLSDRQVVADFVLTPTKIRVCLYSKGFGVPVWLDMGQPDPVEQALSEFRSGLRSLQAAPPDKRLKIAQAQLPSFHALIGSLRQRLAQPMFEWVVQNMEGSNEIILSPDGFLHEIPWAALFADTAWEQAGGQVKLMMSPARLALPRPQITGSQCYVLGCAGDPPLGYVESEVRDVVARLPHAKAIYPASQNDLRFDKPPRVLHIAAHGALDAYAPLLSRLHIGEGSFLLADVLRLSLAGTELVTLSACETAGLPERGGAAMALAGAFMCAGARAVLASSWQVDDAATGALMGSFYTFLAEGLPPHVALQNAREAIRQGNWAHPFFWAGFQVME